ncbi:hypothetical protein DPSP01_000498 [Paraphaeosphaeria sporulosa]
MLSKEFRRQKLLDNTAPRSNDEVAVQRAVMGYGDDSPLAREMLASKMGLFEEPKEVSRQESRLSLVAPTGIAIEPVARELEPAAEAEDAASASKSKKDKKKGKKGKRGSQVVDVEPAALSSEPEAVRDADAALPAAPSIQEQFEHDVLQPAFSKEITPAEETKLSTSEGKPVYDAGDVTQYLVASSSTPSPPPELVAAPSTVQAAKETTPETSDKKKGKNEKAKPATPETTSGWGKSLFGALGWGKKKASTSDLKSGKKSPTEEKVEASAEIVPPPVAEGTALEHIRSVEEAKSVYDAGDVAQYLVADSGDATPERVGTPAVETMENEPLPETVPEVQTDRKETISEPAVEASTEDATHSEPIPEPPTIPGEVVAEPAIKTASREGAPVETAPEPSAPGAADEWVPTSSSKKQKERKAKTDKRESVQPSAPLEFEHLAPVIETAPKAPSHTTADVPRDLSVNNDVQQPAESVLPLDTEPAKPFDQPSVDGETVAADDKPGEDTAAPLEQADDDWAPLSKKDRKKKGKKGKAGETDPVAAKAEPIMSGTPGTPVDNELLDEKPMKEPINNGLDVEARQAEPEQTVEDKPVEISSPAEDVVRTEENPMEDVSAPAEQPAVQSVPLSKKGKKTQKKSKGLSVDDTAESSTVDFADSLPSNAELVPEDKPGNADVLEEQRGKPVPAEPEAPLEDKPSQEIPASIEPPVTDEASASLSKKDKKKAKKAAKRSSVGANESATVPPETVTEPTTPDADEQSKDLDAPAESEIVTEGQRIEEATTPVHSDTQLSNEENSTEDNPTPAQQQAEDEWAAPVSKSEKKKKGTKGKQAAAEASVKDSSTLRLESDVLADGAMPKVATLDALVEQDRTGITAEPPATADDKPIVEDSTLPVDAPLEDASVQIAVEEEPASVSKKDKKKAKKAAKRGSLVDIEPSTTETVHEADGKVLAKDGTGESTTATAGKPVEEFPTPIDPAQVEPTTITEDKPTDGIPMPENALSEDVPAPAETAIEAPTEAFSKKDKKKKKKGKKGQSVDVQPALTEEAEAKMPVEDARVESMITDAPQPKLLSEVTPVESAEAPRDQPAEEIAAPQETQMEAEVAEESSAPAPVEHVTADAAKQQQPKLVAEATSVAGAEERSVPRMTQVDDKVISDPSASAQVEPIVTGYLDEQQSHPLPEATPVAPTEELAASPVTQVDDKPVEDYSPSVATHVDDEPATPLSKKAKKKKAKRGKSVDIDPLSTLPDDIAESQEPNSDTRAPSSAAPKDQKESDVTIPFAVPLDSQKTSGPSDSPPIESSVHVLTATPDAPVHSEPVENSAEGATHVEDGGAMPSKKDKKKKGKKGKASEPSTPAVDERIDPLAEAGEPVVAEQSVESALPEPVIDEASQDVAEPVESDPTPATEDPVEEVITGTLSKKSKKKKAKKGSISQGVEPEVPPTPAADEPIFEESAARDVEGEAAQAAEIIAPVEQHGLEISEPTEDVPVLDKTPASQGAGTADEKTISQPAEPVDEEVVVLSKKEKKKKGKKGKSASGTVTPIVADAERETRDISAGDTVAAPAEPVDVEPTAQEAAAAPAIQPTSVELPAAIEVQPIIDEPIAQPEIQPTSRDLSADTKLRPVVDEPISEQEPTIPLSKKDKKKAKKAKKGASETDTPPVSTPSEEVLSPFEQPILDTVVVSEPQEIAQPEALLQQDSTPVEQSTSEPQAETSFAEQEQKELDDSTLSKKDKKKKKKSKSVSIIDIEPVTPVQQIPEPVLEAQPSELQTDVSPAEPALVHDENVPEEELKSQAPEMPALKPSKSTWIEYVPPPAPEKETATQRKRRLKREQQEKEKWDEEQRERIAREEREAAETAESTRTAEVPAPPTPEAPIEQAKNLQVVEEPADPTSAATPAEPPTLLPVPGDETKDGEATAVPSVEEPVAELTHEEGQAAPLSKKGEKKAKKAKRASIVDTSGPTTPALPEEQARDVPSDQHLPVVPQPETDGQIEQEPAKPALDVNRNETAPLPTLSVDESRNELQQPLMDETKDGPTQDNAATVPLSKKDKKKAKKAKRGSVVDSEPSTSPATPVEEAKDPLMVDPPPPPDPDPPAQDPPAPETLALEEASVEATAPLSKKDKKKAKKAKRGSVVEEVPAASQDDAFLASETGERLVGDAERHDGGAADTTLPELAVERSLEAPLAEADASVDVEREMGLEATIADQESLELREGSLAASGPDGAQEPSEEILSTSAPKGIEEPPAETPEEPFEDDWASSSTKKDKKSNKGKKKRESIAEEAASEPPTQTVIDSADIPTSESLAHPKQEELSLPSEPVTAPATSNLHEPEVQATEELVKGIQIEPSETAAPSLEKIVNVEPEAPSSSKKKKGKKGKRASTIEQPTPEVPTAEPAFEQITEQQIVEEPSGIVPDASQSSIPELSEELQPLENAPVAEPTDLDIAQSSRDGVPEGDSHNEADAPVVPTPIDPAPPSESQFVEEPAPPTKISKKNKKAKKSKDQSGTSTPIPELVAEARPELVVEPTAVPVGDSQLEPAVEQVVVPSEDAEPEPSIETIAVPNEEVSTLDTKEQVQEPVEDSWAGLSKKDKKKAKKTKARQSGTATPVADGVPEVAGEVERAAATVDEQTTATIKEQPTATVEDHATVAVEAQPDVATAEAHVDLDADLKVPETQSDELGQDVALTTPVDSEVAPSAPVPEEAIEMAALPEPVKHAVPHSTIEAEQPTGDDSPSMSSKAKKKAKKGKAKLSGTATPVIEDFPQLEVEEKESSPRIESPAEEPLSAAPTTQVEASKEILSEVPLEQAPLEPTPDTVETHVLAADSTEQASTTPTAPVTEVQVVDELSGLSKKAKKKAKNGKGKVSEPSTSIVEDIPEVQTDSSREIAPVIPEVNDIAATHEAHIVPAAIDDSVKDVQQSPAQVLQEDKPAESISQPTPEQEETAVDEWAPIPAKKKGKKGKKSGTATPVIEPLAEEVPEIKEKLSKDVATADAQPVAEDIAVPSVEVVESRDIPEDPRIDDAQIVPTSEPKQEEADVDELAVLPAKKKKGKKGKKSGTATPIPEALVERPAEEKIAPEVPIDAPTEIEDAKTMPQEPLGQEATIEQPIEEPKLTEGAESQAEPVPEPQPEEQPHTQQPIEESKHSEIAQPGTRPVAEPEDEWAASLSKKKGKKNKRKVSLATPVTEESSLPPTEAEVSTQQDLPTAIIEKEQPTQLDTEAAEQQGLAAPVVEEAQPTPVYTEASVQKHTAQTAVEDVTRPISVPTAEPDAQTGPTTSSGPPTDLEDGLAAPAPKKKSKKGKGKKSGPQTPIAEISEPLLDNAEVVPEVPAALDSIEADRGNEPSPAEVPAEPVQMVSTEIVEVEKPVLERKLSKTEKKAKKKAAASTLDVEPIIERAPSLEEPMPELNQEPVQESVQEPTQEYISEPLLTRETVEDLTAPDVDVPTPGVVEHAPIETLQMLEHPPTEASSLPIVESETVDTSTEPIIESSDPRSKDAQREDGQANFAPKKGKKGKKNKKVQNVIEAEPQTPDLIDIAKEGASEPLVEPVPLEPTAVSDIRNNASNLPVSSQSPDIKPESASEPIAGLTQIEPATVLPFEPAHDVPHPSAVEFELRQESNAKPAQITQIETSEQPQAEDEWAPISRKSSKKDNKKGKIEKDAITETPQEVAESSFPMASEHVHQTESSAPAEPEMQLEPAAEALPTETFVGTLPAQPAAEAPPIGHALEPVATTYVPEDAPKEVQDDEWPLPVKKSKKDKKKAKKSKSTSEAATPIVEKEVELRHEPTTVDDPSTSLREERQQEKLLPPAEEITSEPLLEPLVRDAPEEAHASVVEPSFIESQTSLPRSAPPEAYATPIDHSTDLARPAPLSPLLQAVQDEVADLKQRSEALDRQLSVDDVAEAPTPTPTSMFDVVSKLSKKDKKKTKKGKAATSEFSEPSTPAEPEGIAKMEEVVPDPVTEEDIPALSRMQSQKDKKKTRGTTFSRDQPTDEITSVPASEPVETNLEQLVEQMEQQKATESAPTVARGSDTTVSAEPITEIGVAPVELSKPLVEEAPALLRKLSKKDKKKAKQAALAWDEPTAKSLEAIDTPQDNDINMQDPEPVAVPEVTMAKEPSEVPDTVEKVAPLARKLSNKDKKKAKQQAVLGDEPSKEADDLTPTPEDRDIPTAEPEVIITDPTARADEVLVPTIPEPEKPKEDSAPLSRKLSKKEKKKAKTAALTWDEPVAESSEPTLSTGTRDGAPTSTEPQPTTEEQDIFVAPASALAEPTMKLPELMTAPETDFITRDEPRALPSTTSPPTIQERPSVMPVVEDEPAVSTALSRKQSKRDKKKNGKAAAFELFEPATPVNETATTVESEKLSADTQDPIEAEPVRDLPAEDIQTKSTTMESSVALPSEYQVPEPSLVDLNSSHVEEQVPAIIDETPGVPGPEVEDEWALPIKKSKKDKRKSKKMEAAVDDEPTQVIKPNSPAVAAPATEATPVIDLPQATSSRDTSITEPVSSPTVELPQLSTPANAAKKKNKKHKLAAMFEPPTPEETLASKARAPKIQEETARDIHEAVPEDVQFKQFDVPRAIIDEPRAKSPEHDIDFAATVAAGLKESGFNTDLVLNDPAFHRTSSPQSVRDIAPDDDVAAARHGASKSKFGNLGRSPSPTSPESEVPTVKEAPQPIVAVAAESAPTFDPMDILNDPTFAQRKSPPGVLEEADPEELWSSGSKGKKAKGKKKRASLVQDGVGSPAVEIPTTGPSVDELSRDRPMPEATLETTDDFWDEQPKRKGREDKAASKRANTTESVQDSDMLSGAITPFEEDFEQQRSVEDSVESKKIVNRNDLTWDEGAGKKNKKKKKSIVPETMVAAASAAALAAVISDKKEEKKSEGMELPPTFDQIPKSLGGVEPSEYPFPALPTPEERTGFSVQGKHAHEEEIEEEWAPPAKKKGKKDSKSRGKEREEKDNDFIERTLNDMPEQKGRHVSQSDPFYVSSTSRSLEQENAGHMSPNHKRREHPVPPEAEPEEKRLHLSGPSQHDLSIPEDPSSLASSRRQELAHSSADKSNLDTTAHPTGVGGHSPIIEPTWSFGDIRDSGVHVADSPTVPKSPQLPTYADVRDSGYHDTTFETPRKSKGSNQPVEEADSNKKPRSKEPVTPHRSRALEEHDEVRSRSPSLPELPSLAAVASPNAIDSATRERSSYLFDSSPSTRQYGESSPAAKIGAATAGAAAVAVAASARNTRDSQRHDKHIPSESDKKLSSPERDVKQQQPYKSIFGDPTEKKAEQVRKLSTPSNKHMRTPSSVLDPIKEASPDDSPLQKRHARKVSEAGLPDREVKSSRRSQSPKSFSERMKSPPPVTPTPASRKNVPSKIDTSPPVQRKGSPWQQVHESVDRTMTLSPARRLPHDHSPTTTDPIKVRIAEQRSPSVFSDRSVNMRSPDADRPLSAMSNRSASSLRRVDRSRSGDLRAAAKIGEARAHDAKSQSNLAGIALAAGATAAIAAGIASSSKYDPVKDKGKGRAEMPDVYEAWGEAQGSPMSPTRPPSVRKRQSIQILDLQSQLENLAAQNRSLEEARLKAEEILQQASQQRDVDQQVVSEAVEARDRELHQKDIDIGQLRDTLQRLQQEIGRLTELNNQLTDANRNLTNDANARYAQLQAEGQQVQDQWQQSTRELEQLRAEHNHLTKGMQAAIAAEIGLAIDERNAEINRLNAELEGAREQIKKLQQQILETKKPNESFLTVRDEDYFDSACQQLCQHVQQWVLRFSKFSDARACRLSSEVTADTRLDTATRQKIDTRLDNAILDGSDVDMLLADRVKRRDVFMSVVMTMIWEYVFTRYLFGMDREQRQKLKSLEKTLSEVGPTRAVAQWRAITLSLLSKREPFVQQRAQDTEAVVHEIYSTLATLLPPPSHLQRQIQESLRNVMRLAVSLSIEMRTQRAEYIMLPPLQPEYDTNGDLVAKVTFNASLMNERSGQETSNDELEARNAIVKIVLFPLVVKKGDDFGEGDDEIVVCPAQVLVARPNNKKVVRVMSGAMSVDSRKRSSHSLAPTSIAPESSIMDLDSTNMI